MKRATLERLAAVLVLAACICAECIPLLLALVAAAALCVGVTNSQAIANLSRKKLICPYCRGLEGDCQV